MRLSKLVSTLLAGSLALSAAAAPTSPPPTHRTAPRVSIQAETLNLPNGMTFILVPRSGAPTFSGFIAFKVGGVDSAPGETGLAHMFEHMAFKGTRHLGTKDWEKEAPILEEIRKVGDALTLLRASGKASPSEVANLEARLKELSDQDRQLVVKDEFDRFYSQAGQQSLNASTGEDTTQYFVSLPANAMELWMLLESQRLREPVMREFYSERDVIGQERLMRTDNDPMGKLYAAFAATAFIASPYRNPTIGWASDIPALTMRGAEEFFQRNYSPSNAVGILCGNFDVEKAKVLIGRYFATIPRRGDPLPIVTKEPAQETERRATVLFDANPMMLVGFHKPTWPSREDTVLDVIQALLSDGRTSRLYRRLVEKDKLVLDVSASNGDPGTRLDNLFVIFAVPNEGVGYDRVEAALFGELDRLKAEPVPAAELEKAKTRILASYLRRLNSTLGTCFILSSYQLVTGDWKNTEKYLDEVLSVTPEEIQKAATSAFAPSNRTVAQLVKPAATPAEKETRP